MDDQELPARAWAVVAMPAEIDQATAWRAGEDLALAFGPGTSIVVADLTATTFCDSSGVQMFACARMRAMVDNTELGRVAGDDRSSSQASEPDDRPR